MRRLSFQRVRRGAGDAVGVVRLVREDHWCERLERLTRHAPLSFTSDFSGPTASASTLLNYSYQYWTSRGEGAVGVDGRSCCCIMHSHLLL